MTLQALQEAIARLIIKRAKNHGNAEEQARINKKTHKIIRFKIYTFKSIEISTKNTYLKIYN